MSKISKITIVHTVSRKFEDALEICQRTCQECSVEVLDVLSIFSKKKQFFLHCLVFCN